MTDKLIATLNKAGVRNISTDLWGIFYEDISYSGDGGLNADLVQNGAFEYNRADSSDWSNYSFWRKIVPAGSFAAFDVLTDNPVAEENPHYASVEVEQAPASLENIGWDGMVSVPAKPTISPHGCVFPAIAKLPHFPSPSL